MLRQKKMLSAADAVEARPQLLHIRWVANQNHEMTSQSETETEQVMSK